MMSNQLISRELGPPPVAAREPIDHRAGCSGRVHKEAPHPARTKLNERKPTLLRQLYDESTKNSCGKSKERSARFALTVGGIKDGSRSAEVWRGDGAGAPGLGLDRRGAIQRGHPNHRPTHLFRRASSVPCRICGHRGLCLREHAVVPTELVEPAGGGGGGLHLLHRPHPRPPAAGCVGGSPARLQHCCPAH